MGVRFAVAAVLAVALAGCVQPEPQAVHRAEYRTKVPDYLLEEGVAYGLALQIDRRCRDLRLDRGHFDRQSAAMEKRLKAEGYTEGDLQSMMTLHLPEQELQDALLDYVRANDILLTRNETFCAAGRKEVAANSPIGRYLKVIG